MTQEDSSPNQLQTPMNDNLNTTFVSKPDKLIIGTGINYLALLGLIALYSYGSLTEENPSLVIWLIPTLSLAMFIPGMIKDYARGYSWLCFVILMHFTVGVTNAMAPNGHIGDWIQVALSSILFISAMMTSRWIQAWQSENS